MNLHLYPATHRVIIFEDDKTIYECFGENMFEDEVRPKMQHIRNIRDIHLEINKGFDSHQHENIEIVKIPVKGVLRHTDDEDEDSLVSWPYIDVLSAGSGVTDSVYNASAVDELRYLQIEIYPIRLDIEPFYSRYNLDKVITPNMISTFISPDGPVRVDQDVKLSRLMAFQAQEHNYNLATPASFLNIYVIDGVVEINGHNLHAGDSATVTEEEKIIVAVLDYADILFVEENVKHLTAY